METILLRHSIATPISSILINLELALLCIEKNNQPVKPNFNHHLNTALRAAHYLKRILNHNSKSKFSQSFNVKSAILEVTQIAKHQRSNNLIAYLDISDELKITGNKLFFQESLICMINNAFESYSSDALNQIVMIKAYHDLKNLWINIVDGGCGMNWLHQRMAIKNKVSFKKNHSGVGLAFAKKIIEKSFDGKLIIESKKGQGTKIKLKIPLKA